MPRIRSLRIRIALAYIVGTLAVSGLVAVATYVLAARQLTHQRTEASVDRSFNDLRRVIDLVNRKVRDQQVGSRSPQTVRVLPDEVLEVLQRAQSRVVVASGDTAVSSSISVTIQTVPRELRDAVDRGGVAYAAFGSPRQLAFGAPIPRTSLDVYFVYPLRALDRTLALLQRILIAVVGAAAGLAGFVGFRLAARTVRPLRIASDAARQVAQGHLETRLEQTSDDELGSLARSFNHMTEALEERITRERRFVADASHELRTPLTTLRTSIEFLADRTDELSPKLRGVIALADEEVRALQKLVDDLLELNRVEAGGVEVAREEVDLVAFATELTRRRAPEAEVEIIGPEQLFVRTDKTRLERVVGNLVENAVVHSGGKGVRILLEAVNGETRIVVADQGPGIPEDLLPRIFERFWRGDQSRTRDGRSGAGLGLAIARENATVLGADIDVESVQGEGTRFEVRLPESHYAGDDE